MADVSSVSPTSEETEGLWINSDLYKEKWTNAIGENMVT